MPLVYYIWSFICFVSILLLSMCMFVCVYLQSLYSVSSWCFSFIGFSVSQDQRRTFPICCGARNVLSRLFHFSCTLAQQYEYMITPTKTELSIRLDKNDSYNKNSEASMPMLSLMTKSDLNAMGLERLPHHQQCHGINQVIERAISPGYSQFFFPSILAYWRPFTTFYHPKWRSTFIGLLATTSLAKVSQKRNRSAFSFCSSTFNANFIAVLSFLPCPAPAVEIKLFIFFAFSATVI